MKRFAFISICLAFATYISNAQILKGRITNDTGDPIPYATVYIQELKQGTTSNTKGDYEIRLPAGKYQIIYQSLGFSPVLFTIAISDQPITRNVILPLQYYQIPEVRISATGEDPAYGIMRKAVGMAPYFLNNISYYKAEVYLKGTLVMKKIPKILQKAINAEARKEDGSGVSSNKIKEGDVYIMESFNEMEFTAPDKYSQKVISVNSTFPDEGNDVSPMDFIQASFYEPLVGGLAISPLSPQSFSYYKFKYLGASPQGNYIVNKIQVIPKMKSQQLFEGTIYIIEDLWCLHSVDLMNDNIAGKIRIEQIYIPVQDDIWMPVSHKFSLELSIIGVKADAGYGGSVKYLEVKPNISLKRPEQYAVSSPGQQVQAQTTREQPVSKNEQKIENILEKEELSNRDMVALSRLMTKESEKALPDSVRNNLELKENMTRTVEKDAGKKDSAFWAEIRPIPLSDIEMKSISVRDSIRQELALKKASPDSLKSSDQKKKNTFSRALGGIAFGHTWSDTSHFSFNFGGLLNLDNLSFNTVDGFIYGVNFRITKSWKGGKNVSFYPDIRWAFSRENIMWRINGNYTFNRVKNSQIYFRTGITSRDISTGGSINTLLNSISSLFFRDNYLKLYESRYFTAGYRSRISMGLNIDLSVGIDDRKKLENTTDFSFTKSSDKYSPNLPENDYLYSGSFPLNAAGDQRQFEFVTNVTFTPRQRYRVYNTVKVPAGSDWPTFSLAWKHAISEFSEMIPEYRHYDMIRFEVYKRHEIGGFSEFNWRFRTGGYLDNRLLTYYDFFHFNSQPLPVLLDDYQDAFRLPAYYSLSTPEFFGEAHIKYTTPYLLLKHLPGLSKTLMRENLSFAYLGSRFHPHYTELGYSISEISLFGELGVWLGFENLRYKRIGVRLVLKLG
jgi:hypothetical protein